MKLPGFLHRMLVPPPPRYHGVMGIFTYVDDVTGAILALRQAVMKNVSIFSPIPYHDIDRAI